MRSLPSSSVAAGEILAPGAGILLALVAAGVVLAASAGGEEEGVAISRDRAIRAASLSVVAAACFGISLFGGGQAAGLLPVFWAVLPARVVGTIFVAVPMVVLGRFRMTRAALPFVVATGIAEVVGFSFFTLGAREGIAVASVLSSMFAPIAAIAAFVVFRERLGRRQIVGIALVCRRRFGPGPAPGLRRSSSPGLRLPVTFWRRTAPCMGIVTITVARLAVADEVEAVYRRDGDRLWRALYAFAGDRDVASDAVAEAFAQALRADRRSATSQLGLASAFRIAAGDLKRQSALARVPISGGRGS